MNYEEKSRDDENPYKAGKDGYFTEAEEYEDIEKYHEFEYLEAIQIIEEANAMLKNEHEYADLVIVTNYVIEHEQVIEEYSHTHNTELAEKISSLENIIIDMSIQIKSLVENASLTQKDKITVKEFQKFYSISEEAQRKLRKRMKDPLPFIQINERGNVLYDYKEVEKWFENYKQ